MDGNSRGGAWGGEAGVPGLDSEGLEAFVMMRQIDINATNRRSPQVHKGDTGDPSPTDPGRRNAEAGCPGWRPVPATATQGQQQRRREDENTTSPCENAHGGGTFPLPPPPALGQLRARGHRQCCAAGVRPQGCEPDQLQQVLLERGFPWGGTLSGHRATLQGWLSPLPTWGPLGSPAVDGSSCVSGRGPHSCGDGCTAGQEPQRSPREPQTQMCSGEGA